MPSLHLLNHQVDANIMKLSLLTAPKQADEVRDGKLEETSRKKVLT
jgi:hypothetical protein